MEGFQEDLSHSKILPKILVPNKLLAPNNFKYHMKNVSQILDYAKEQERAQTSQANQGGNLLQLNEIQQTPSNVNLNSTQQIRNSMQQHNKPTTAKSNISSEDISKSYKSLLFTARNFGITSSHYFHTENSSLHAAQRYGRHKKQKLKPIRQTKSGKFFESHLGFKPQRQIQDYEHKNQFYKKVITIKGLNLVVTFQSFQIDLTGEEEELKKHKDRVKIQLTFQDALYLSQHSFEYINTFFQKYVDYSEPRNSILIDWEGFSKIPFIKQTQNDDQLYPTQIYKDIERSSKVLQVKFPQLNFYLNEAAHSQNYTCSQLELQELIKNNFTTLPQIVEKRFNFEEASRIHNQVLFKQGLSSSINGNDGEEEEDYEKQFNPEDKDLVNSVTKIQASFKGKKARDEVQNLKQKKLQQIQEEENTPQANQENQIQEKADEEEDLQEQFNPEDKDLVNSVTKIQASFKGKKAREEVKELQQKRQQKQEMEEQFNPEDKDLINSVTKIQASFKGKKDRDEVKQLKKQKQEQEFKEQFNPEDKDLINSVTKIQASFKGKKDREEVKQIKQQKQLEEEEQKQKQEQEELQQQFNPEDKDLVNSVTKIQASFKGKKSRDEVKQIKQKKQQENEFKEQFKEDDQDLVNSVTKIQASFKGKQARQQVQELKKGQNNENQEIKEENEQNIQNEQKQQENNQEEEEDYAKQYDPSDEQLVGKITKIQATFKGNQVRKQKNKEGEQGEQGEQGEEKNEEKQENEVEQKQDTKQSDQKEKIDNKLEI